MKKDNQLYLFAEYELGYKVNEGYELIKLVRLDCVSSKHPVSRGRKLEDYILEQKRLLKQLEDHYQRKIKARKNALKILEELKNEC